MKKQLLTLVLTAIAAMAFAQKVTYGLKAGINLAKLSIVRLDNVTVPKQSMQHFIGLNVGAVADISFTKFSIQPGVIFSQKGFRYPNTQYDQTGKPLFDIPAKIILNYIEIPVNVLYKTDLTKNSAIHVGGGPYVGYGLSARRIMGSTTIKGSFSDKTNPVYYQNPDVGANFLAGVLVADRYLLDVNFGLGLANIGRPNYRIKNRVVGISLGYMFK
jgi:hypothetical protein